MSNYLVTGGAGFIGSHLCELLLDRGHKVFVIDNLSTGTLSNMPSQCYFAGRDIVQGLRKIDSKLDGLFHLGMPSSIPPYKVERQYVTEVIETFIYLLDWCLKKNTKLVFTSTSNVYNGNPLPWREVMPIHPKDFYSDTRRYLERLAEIYHNQLDSKVVGIRPFANYGPREENKGSWASIISQLIWAKNSGRVFKVYGDGTQTRDYIHAKDTARAFYLAMLSRETSGVFNAGTGIQTSFNELIRIIGTRVKYIENPVKAYVEHGQADMTLSKLILGFEARISIEEGIRGLLDD